MNKTSIKFLLPLLFVFASLALLLAACGPVDLTGAARGGGASDCSAENNDGDNDFCVELTGNTGSWSVPDSSYTIYDFTIKAGTQDFGAVEGCYVVTQTASSVSWERVGDGPDCKDISHVEVYYRKTPTQPPPNVSYCRAEGNPYPYTVVTVPLDTSTNLPTGYNSSKDIYPIPQGGCPQEPVNVPYCRAEGNPYPYTVVTVPLDSSTNLPTGFNAAKDIYPVPDDGCPEEPVNVPYCRADGDPYPYTVVTVLLDTSTNLPTGFNAADGDLYPVPEGGCPQKPEDVTYCRAEGNPYPYTVVTVPLDSSTNLPTGFNASKGDLYPVPQGGCPKKPVDVPYCRAEGNPYPYAVVTVPLDSSTNLPTGFNAANGDLYPVPQGGCPQRPEDVPYCRADGDPFPYSVVSVPLDPTTNLPTGFNASKGDLYPVPNEGCPKKPQDVPYCRAEGNPYPYTVAVVPLDESTNLPTGFNAANGDLYPVPEDGCPQDQNRVPYCRAEGNPYPYSIVTVSFDEDTQLPFGFDASRDIYPVPEDGCPYQPATCPQFLIFHTFRDQNLEIYKLDGIEGDPDALLINLTQSDAVDCRPSRSPDDAWLVYQSDRNDNVELYFTDLGGGSQIRLTNSLSNNINPMFGPDNLTVAFQSDRNGNWDIFLTDLNSTSERQLTSGTFDEVNPFWSPDLRYMAFQSNRNGTWDIFVLDTETGNETTLVAGVSDEIYPAWSPNGQQIAFLRNDGGVWNLYIIDATGENMIKITDGDGDTSNATWSPEGYRIAYQSERNGNLDIYTYDLRTGTEYRLTDYEGPDSGPTWDCGGSMIAFTSTRDGNPNILQVPWQGGAQSNLTIDPATDKWSEWSPTKEPASRGR